MSNLNIRRAEEGDLGQYFRWVNEAQTRRNSFHTQSIDFETHKAWFYGKLHNAESYLYVVEKDAIPIGQVRFDLNADVAEVSFSLDECFRGTGVGGELLKIALHELSDDCKHVNYISAKVKVDNIASNRIFLNLGFSIFESNQKVGLNVYRIAVSKLD